LIQKFSQPVTRQADLLPSRVSRQCKISVTIVGKCRRVPKRQSFACDETPMTYEADDVRTVLGCNLGLDVSAFCNRHCCS
jgi:hypothetical protein